MEPNFTTISEVMDALLEGTISVFEADDALRTMKSSGQKESSVIRDNLYPIVEKSLNDKQNQKKYKENIDRYMARHIDCYSSIGPSTRPTLSPSDISNFLEIVGLPEKTIKDCLATMKGNNSAWKNFNSPYNIGIVLSIRYFGKQKNPDQIRNGLLYMVTNIYQYMFWKYYHYPPNEAVMAYTIANLSQRFKLKKSGTILAALMDIMETCYDTHKSRIDKCMDIDILKFINDATSRINSFMKKLRNEFEENIKNENYLQSEKDDFSDEHYYEADSDSFAIERITNKVLTNLVINGPDRQLITFAANNCSVSVNTLQTSILTLVSENNREDIRSMIERLLALYLNDNPSGANIKDIGTNKFYVYCTRVYRQSNTSNPNIIEIKKILDKWVDELDLKRKVSTPGSLGNYRKAIFMFFVFTIEKLS